MADIYTSKEDELLITRIINDGFSHTMHKYYILRLALAKSIQIEKLENLDSYLNIKGDRRGEYYLRQVTGEDSQEDDYDCEFRALLGKLHNINLFENDLEYKRILQKHIRRGLDEINRSWKSTDSLYEYIFQDILKSNVILETNNNYDIIKAIEQTGIEAVLIVTLDVARLTHYRIKLKDSNDIGNFKKISTNGQLCSILGVNDISCKPVNGEPMTFNLTIAKDEKEWKKFDYFMIKNWIKEIPNSLHMGIFLGIDTYDKPFYFDLKDTPHLFIAGATGSGKSVTLHLVITSLMQQSANNIEFVLIDPKKVELSIYSQSEKLSDISDNQVITDNQEILETLKKLEDEMDDRYEILSQNGVQNISELKNGELKNIVVIIEELADIVMSSDTKFNRECERILGRLAQKSRACGIHLILVTQRPSSEVFSGVLRTNIPSRIALKVSKSTESKIIIDEVGAEKLTGKGDCLIKLATLNTIQRVHSLLLRQEQIKELIN